MCCKILSISWFSKSSLTTPIDNNIKFSAARFYQVRVFERSAIFRTDTSENTSYTAQNMKFCTKDFSVNVTNSQKTADLVTFTVETLNEKLHFL